MCSKLLGQRSLKCFFKGPLQNTSKQPSSHSRRTRYSGGLFKGGLGGLRRLDGALSVFLGRKCIPHGCCSFLLNTQIADASAQPGAGKSPLVTVAAERVLHGKGGRAGSR